MALQATTDMFLREGRYRVGALLGEGAQGTTFEATDTRDGRTVAIKRFRVRGARSWKDVELAEREARVLATLDHPLIPRYLEHFEHDGSLYLVMERVEGETLEAICSREGPLSEREVRRFLVDADRTLTYLHGRAAPIVHRDIKPRNVVRRPNGSYVLVDFGAVSEMVRRHEAGSTIVGTYGYMAPEQLQGRAQPGTDVYAVGATALAALAGKEPEELPHRGLHIDVEAAIGGRVSPALVGALWRMLEPDPDARPTNLGVALEGVAVSQPAPGPLAPAASLGPAARSVEEAALLKSTRKLLWLLWGLGWILVPVVLGGLLNVPSLIPLVMFGSLAALFIVTWHDNAILGALMRRAGLSTPAPERLAAAPRLRVDSDAGQPKVRVNTSDLRPDEVVGQTELDSVDALREAKRLRR